MATMKTCTNYICLLLQQAAEDGITNPDGSALDMKARMDPWLNQMGYPLVTVTRGAGGTAVASRSHFLNPVNQDMNTPSEWKYIDILLYLVYLNSNCSIAILDPSKSDNLHRWKYFLPSSEFRVYKNYTNTMLL